MGRRCLKIAYLGTAYCGWQVQKNGISVQQTVQEALAKLLGGRPALTGCSRTDSGVHANAFYCHFNGGENIPNKGLVAGLNTLLPGDIAVLDCFSVPPDFHARYSATGKNYIYKIFESPTPSPFLNGRALWLKNAVDLEKMNAACAGLVGTHNFKSFCAAGSSVQSTVRTVSACFAERSNGLLTFSVTANGFLYNMVRIMVGTVLEAATGRLEPTQIKNILALENRAAAGKTAPACGLYLNRVFYGEALDCNKKGCKIGTAKKGEENSPQKSGNR